jgi:hypothetical protein
MGRQRPSSPLAARWYVDPLGNAENWPWSGSWWHTCMENISNLATETWCVSPLAIRKGILLLVSTGLPLFQWQGSGYFMVP